MTNFKTILSYSFRDLRRQKVRSILGIAGVMVSVALLTIVLFIADSISVSFIDYLTIDAGDQDMRISVRHYDTEPENRTSYFEFAEMSENIIQNIPKIEYCIPRFELFSQVNETADYNTTKTINVTHEVRVVGLNFTLENELGFGAFKKNEEPLEIERLDRFHFMVYETFNEITKLTEGDAFNFTIYYDNGTEFVNKNFTLIFDGTFDFELKFPGYYRGPTIIVSLETIYEMLGVQDYGGQCSILISTFEEGEIIYDIRDVETSYHNAKAIAEDVQYLIGFEYYIDLPKLEYLGFSEFLSVALSIIFVFISIVAMLIAGILINGILSTSVEERIREFGVFRTLGAHKVFNLLIVMGQGFLLCLIGTTLGVIFAIFGTQLMLAIVNAAIPELIGSFTAGGLVFSYSLNSILIAYIIGIIVSLAVSITPALKVMRLQIVEAINPYRREDVLYHLRKRASVNYKIILVGIILAGNGGFIYFVMPQLLVSMDFALIAGVLIAILLIFLIGLTLAGLGLMPVILNLVTNLFRPFAGKTIHVIKIFVNRFQRRNNNTVVMFAFSFSFVIFVSSLIGTLQAQVADTVRFNNGAYLVVRTTTFSSGGGDGGGGGLFGFGGGGLGGGGGGFGLFSDTTSPERIHISADIDPLSTLTTEFQQELMTIKGIERTSSVIASPNQLSQIYVEIGKEFDANISDYVGFQAHRINLYGIDENYKSTIFMEEVRFSEGDLSSFDKLFESDIDNCIISTAIAQSLNLRLGEEIRITITRGDEIEYVPFFIIGIADALPGFSRFKSSVTAASGGGVLISQENYVEYMDIPEPAWIDKIFIKLADDKIPLIDDIEEDIKNKYNSQYDFYVLNVVRSIENQVQAFRYINTLFQLITMTTVIICLFGLLAASYSTILERKKEIAIVRTLGLKGNQVNRLFIIESLIIMISSGTIGVLVGWLTAWLLTSNLTTFTDTKFSGSFPFDSLIFVYVLCTIVTLIGMFILLKRVRTGNIIEIYRETAI